MLYPLYTNKQINIPYLLKIGDGKVKKIGKYLADKNLTNAVFIPGWRKTALKRFMNRTCVLSILKK